MSRYFKDHFWVIPKNGELIVYDNTGKEISCQMQVSVDDCAGEIPTATLKMAVSFAASEEEMMKAIEDFK
jgi:hypothetical protein